MRIISFLVPFSPAFHSLVFLPPSSGILDPDGPHSNRNDPEPKGLFKIAFIELHRRKMQD